LITLAVQKCCFSLPPDVVNKAPTAGSPVNAWPFLELEAKCRMARTKPVAMSPVAPLAGATVAITATASAMTTATRVGLRENQRAGRPARNSTRPDHPASFVRFWTVDDKLRDSIVIQNMELYQGQTL
jgi:hypothetical protein